MLRRELLKAMDTRLSALQQEQKLAFSWAAAAGFDVDRIDDLLAFSEFFGADRLRYVQCHIFARFRLKISTLHSCVLCVHGWG